ncbi:MAG: dockerin type I domain-containing protein, partial [Planctomycetota bacterium]|nr:dockerin type I domain-containing protein [Planctomycetota bacterium]
AATVPATVTIPVGSTSATFTVTAVNDVIADGNQSSIITASASGFVSGNAQVTVVDDETATLVLAMTTSSILENGGTTTGTITRNTPSSSALIVNLSSSDPTAATVPATVTIPVGLESVGFEIRVIDNTGYQGNQIIEFVASTLGFARSAANLEIAEDDPQWPWHNQRNPLDVDADGSVSPLDVLTLVNALNTGGGGTLPSIKPGELEPPPFFDVDYDGLLSPLDVLVVINHLNQRGVGEGEFVQSKTADQLYGDSDWVDHLFIRLRRWNMVRYSSSSRC